jgi:hypothetical protein
MPVVKEKTEPIELGPVDEVSNLFSFPPNYNTLFFSTPDGSKVTQTLEDTIQLYLDASLRRDGFTDSKATAAVVKNHVHVAITGQATGAAAASAYATALPRFLKAGKIGLTLSEKIATTKTWQYNWRFFLPLGLSMVNHKSVQLLHFPPDSVLSKAQDYLAASTTKRWAELLVANGVLPKDTDSYQNIVDAAPVAAPHADGGTIDVNVCLAYTDYIRDLLDAWLPKPDGHSRPMVTLGVPPRNWLKQTFAPTQDLGVLSLVNFKLPSGLAVSTLTGNHPSMIFNLDNNLKDDPGTPVDDRLCPLIPTMQDDLITAGWQAAMVQNPTGDPAKALSDCKKKWTNSDRTAQICQLIYQQVFNMTPQAAAQRVHDHPLPNCVHDVVTNPTGPSATQHRAKAALVAENLGQVGSYDA